MCRYTQTKVLMIIYHVKYVHTHAYTLIHMMPVMLPCNACLRDEGVKESARL